MGSYFSYGFTDLFKKFITIRFVDQNGIKYQPQICTANDFGGDIDSLKTVFGDDLDLIY